jgi:membrane-bound lytic murein transglycosylase D
MQQYAVVDDSCLVNSVNVDYPDSVYIRKLSQLPTVIEMPYNSVVRRYIDMYVQKRRALVENLLGLSTYYMPIFEEALEREGLPLELKYLPIIESALRPDATSRVGAAGLWQFMVKTGKSMGLEVNSLVDERRDPIKSSAMAARYLKDLYSIYHDWALAIASYNCGPGNVSKAIRRSGGKTDYWEIYPYLPRETRGYVPAFIAVNYVMNYYSDHNICPVLTRRPLLTDTVQVTRRVHLQLSNANTKVSGNSLSHPRKLLHHRVQLLSAQCSGRKTLVQLCDSGCGMVLRRIDVAGSPANFCSESYKRANKNGGLNCHVEGPHDASAF